MTFKKTAKTRLLAGLGAAMLSSLVAGGAFAANTQLQNLTNATVTGHTTIFNSSATGGGPLSNTGNIDATVVDATGGITQTDVGGVAGPNSYDVGANIMSALATGNSVANEITSQIQGSGQAALGLAQNSGNISASVDTSTLAIDLTGFTSGSATNSDNTILARATANSGSNTIAPTFPAGGYDSTLLGQSELHAPPSTTPSTNIHEANGSIVATSGQMNAGATVDAAVRDDDVSLSLNSTGNNTVSSSPALDDNTIVATGYVNDATTTVDLAAGGAPSFAGSVAASNIQLNLDGDANAQNSNSTIMAEVTQGNDSDTDVNTLTGGLSVQGNTIASNVAGNRSLGGQGEAGNRILIGDQLSIAGASRSVTSSVSTGSIMTFDLASADDKVTSEVGADLLIMNAQGNYGQGSDNELSLTSATSGGTVGASADSLVNGAITVADNSISAQTSGNSASSAVQSGRNAAGFDASVALASTQTNYRTDVGASTTDATVRATTGRAAGGVTDQASVKVGGNNSAATATGNSAQQTIALTATDLNSAGGQVELTSNGSGATASGQVTIANLQTNVPGQAGTGITATNDGSTTGIVADSQAANNVITGSTLQVANNTQSAAATGSDATSGISLTGNTVGGGAGIVNAQVDRAPVSATLSDAFTVVLAGTHVENSTLTTGDGDGGDGILDGNTQQALARGTRSANNLNVESNTLTSAAVGTANGVSVTYDASNTSAPFHGGTANHPVVQTTFGVFNDQTESNVVEAMAMATAGVRVEGQVTGSKIHANGNSVLAGAYANDATSNISLAATTVASAGQTSIAHVGNVQTSSGDVRATAKGGATVPTNNGPFQVQPVIKSFVASDVTGSTVTTSGNVVLADATANSASNGIDVIGTTIATQRTTAPGLTIDGSSLPLVALDDADAFGITNAQSASGQVASSLINDNDTVGDDSDDFSASVNTEVGGDIVDSTVASDKNVLSATAKGNGAGNDLAFTGVNEFTTTSGVMNFQMMKADIAAGVGIEGLSGTPNNGGVTIMAQGDAITDSTLSVNDNTTRGIVTGNSAANTLSVSGNAIASASNLSASNASVTVPAINMSTTADHSVVSLQVVDTAALDSEVAGAFGVDTLDNTQGVDLASIVNSTLSVSGNKQRAETVGNTVQNALTLDGNAVSAGSALLSAQTSLGETDVSAASNMEAYLPVASTSSAIDMSDNGNVSLAVLNDATNMSTVSTDTAINTLGAGTNAALNVDMATETGSVDADHVLQNVQLALDDASSVGSTATTTLYNEDRVATTTGGLADGSFTMNGNSTTAEATVNRAFNGLALNAGTSLSATGGLSNAQVNNASASADATTKADLMLAGDASPAVGGSSVALNGNGTTALARGNFASNALNVTTGANYATPTTGASVSSTMPGNMTVSAAAGVLNAQTNTGAIMATSAGASYTVALNSAANTGAPVVQGSTVALTGNSIDAQAYGNYAVNSIQLSARPGGAATAALGSYQANTGAITATMTGAHIGMTSAGAVGNSSFGVRGNSIGASAVGNSVSNSIGNY